MLQRDRQNQTTKNWCPLILSEEDFLVEFSHSVVSDSLWPHGLQHARLPCPSPTPGAYSNSSPSSLWCHPTILSSVIPFSSCLQSFPASRSFPMSQLFASGGQSIGVSASASVLPMNIQGWFPLGWTGRISLQSKGLSRVFSNTQFKNLNCSVLRFFYGPTLTLVHDYWKNHSFDLWTFVTSINQVKNQINQEKTINHKSISKRSMVVQMFGKASYKPKLGKKLRLEFKLVENTACNR